MVYVCLSDWVFGVLSEVSVCSVWFASSLSASSSRSILRGAGVVVDEVSFCVLLENISLRCDLFRLSVLPLGVVTSYDLGSSHTLDTF